MFSNRNKNHVLIFFALLAASIISTALVVARAFHTGSIVYGFLVWNLFLAWMPLVFSWLAYKRQQQTFWLLLMGFLWLIFFPNAPYLVTDLIHLSWSSHMPIWFDAMMIFTFALTGLLLGLISLYTMQAIVTRRLGAAVSWIFVVAAVGMSGFGVYIGRFLRWNSWDLFSQPIPLFQDIVHSLVNPQMMLKTYTVSLLLSAISMFAYVVLFSLSRIVVETANEPAIGVQSGQ